MALRELNREQAIQIVGELYDDKQNYFIKYDDNTLLYEGFGVTIQRHINEDGTSGRDLIKMDYTPREIDIKTLFELN
jgi:hypothetical protein